MNDTLNMSFPLLDVDYVMRSSAFRLDVSINTESCRLATLSVSFSNPLFLKNRMRQKEDLKWLII